MEILVGNTGFVGSNLMIQHRFDKTYNSQNIQEAYGTNPKLLVYAGVPAAMYIANQNPQRDFEIIEKAIDNIKKINPQKLVLISTVAVYDNTIDVDENWKINSNNLTVYGKNRLYLEQWVENNIEDYHIVRLPAIYGYGLKKNFLYDYIHIIPSLLKKDIYIQLLNQNALLKNYYVQRKDNFYECKKLTDMERRYLKEYFQNCKFNALNFTDSRSSYQFYNLEYLWEHIKIVLMKNIKLVNFVVEPIIVSELYYELTNKVFNNILSDNQLYNYNIRTRYSDVFDGKRGYIYDKDMVVNQIKDYILQQNIGE